MQIGYDRRFIYGEIEPPDVLAEFTEEFGRFQKHLLKELDVDLDEAGKAAVTEFLAALFEYAFDNFVDCRYDEEFIRKIYYEGTKSWVMAKTILVMWQIVNGRFMSMTDAEVDGLMKQEQWKTVTEGTGTECGSAALRLGYH